MAEEFDVAKGRFEEPSREDYFNWLFASDLPDDHAH
jgi:hypothetical protein